MANCKKKKGILQVIIITLMIMVVVLVTFTYFQFSSMGEINCPSEITVIDYNTSLSKLPELDTTELINKKLNFSIKSECYNCEYLFLNITLENPKGGKENWFFESNKTLLEINLTTPELSISGEWRIVVLCKAYPLPQFKYACPIRLAEHSKAFNVVDKSVIGKIMREKQQNKILENLTEKVEAIEKKMKDMDKEVKKERILNLLAIVIAAIISLFISLVSKQKLKKTREKIIYSLLSAIILFVLCYWYLIL